MDRSYGELTVSQVNEYLNMLVSSDEILSSLCIKGEISNFKYYPSSGHMYFSLTDEGGVIRAVMFRSQARTLKFMPCDGMKVRAFGKLGVYSQSGAYQIYVSAMLEDGAGKKAEEFEKLKKKLLSEGLFDEERKKKIPEFPSMIGVITSAKGAALQDILDVTGRRYKSAEIIICPSLVQGENAATELCEALTYFRTYGGIDLLIIGRGGGSGEDLSAFNDERLVRMMADCDFPIISAVGHETDFTLCDFVADKRAPTPSAAAELATPDGKMLSEVLDGYSVRFFSFASSVIEKYEMTLSSYASIMESRSPDILLAEKRNEIETLEKMISGSISSKIDLCKSELKAAAVRLDALNPLSVLTRGFCLVKTDGKEVTRVENVAIGDRIDIMMSNGSVRAEVTDIDKNENI